MTTRGDSVRQVLLAFALLVSSGLALAQEKEIPEPLRPWKDWATWDDPHRDCPSPYFNAEQHFCFWPSQLELAVGPQHGKWTMEVVVYGESWVPLPGSRDAWPQNVLDGGEPAAVVERDERPAIKLAPGEHALSGQFTWEQMPQQIAIPSSVGLVALTVDGKAVDIPTWDERGDVWLKRARVEGTDKDLLAVQVYRVVEDGIPLWLRTQIELTVSGKSREEDIGWVLPEGWRLSSIESPVPVAVDDLGRMKAQVRAGKWNVLLHAFRTDDAREFRFAPTAQSVAPSEWIGFQANPQFRLAEFQGLTPVDVTQTTFPEHWRQMPVYLWNTDTTFQLVEKIRGMGGQRPQGLNIQRQFWLDEDGRGLTYRDQIHGQMQRISRLDAAAGQEIGAVRSQGQGQLITANPVTGDYGVEIRTRNLNLQAVGRSTEVANIPATGWQADVDSLSAIFTLPPGWRMLAVFGVDAVEGDWLTSWTLLDLFLLLIFSVAIFRLCGIVPCVIAFFAFGLAYHEWGAPRLTWLFLLMPVALLRVVPPGTLHWMVTAWKWVAAALLIVFLVPFVAKQIENAIYPQLEPVGVTYSQQRGVFRQLGSGGTRLSPQMNQTSDYQLDSAPMFSTEGADDSFRSNQEPTNSMDDKSASIQLQQRYSKSNLQNDPRAKIQTGPADPQWSWNLVQCTWNGPVASEQAIRPVLISLAQHRIITVVRIVLLLMLAAIILGVRRWRAMVPDSTQGATVALFLLTAIGPTAALAQYPDPTMLKSLRERLLESPDAFPQAAEIADVKLMVHEDQLKMELQIHAATQCAVPLPGRLPAWSPITVQLDGDSATASRRDEFLWIIVPAGVHAVSVEGHLPNDTEWEWAFQLKPRHVSIEAPGWSVTGVQNNGVPEQQVFFSRQQKTESGEAAYDRKDFQSIVVVDRYLEIGLVWQVRTEVSRMSPAGKGVSLRIPLLTGESVLTSNVRVAQAGEGRSIDVSLGSGEERFIWTSELPLVPQLRLQAAPTDQWVERWHLIASPIWNTAVAGLPPIFEEGQTELIPTWHPWPGEEAVLQFSKPVAVRGDTMTVKQLKQQTNLGSRQSTHDLELDLECSLGDDFVLQLDSAAEITSLQRDGQVIPVRQDGNQLFVPVHPGRQRINLSWRTEQSLGLSAATAAISLPIPGFNITTSLQIPENRWVLWAHGPLRGPAVRFWIILPCAVLAALVLGNLPWSPLRRFEWILLALGLTQVHLLSAMVVVGWLFLVAWRGRQTPDPLYSFRFNLMQIFLVFLTFVVLAILVAAVGEGLLGKPEMFILGNGSSQTFLQWFQPMSDPSLPQPFVVSISVWFYRLLMLAWALWLATALLHWLAWAWQQFSHGGYWQRRYVKAVAA